MRACMFTNCHLLVNFFFFPFNINSISLISNMQFRHTQKMENLQTVIWRDRPYYLLHQVNIPLVNCKKRFRGIKPTKNWISAF